MSQDPTVTDPDKYKVVSENDRVRVLEYRDRPGDRTSPAGRAVWVAAQQHAGENIGSTESHSIFVELKG